MAAATAPADVAPPAAMAPADVSPLAATPPACTQPADDSPAASPACTTPAELSPPPAYGQPPPADGSPAETSYAHFLFPMSSYFRVISPTRLESAVASRLLASMLATFESEMAWSWTSIIVSTRRTSAQWTLLSVNQVDICSKQCGTSTVLTDSYTKTNQCGHRPVSTWSKHRGLVKFNIGLNILALPVADLWYTLPDPPWSGDTRHRWCSGGNLVEIAQTCVHWLSGEHRPLNVDMVIPPRSLTVVLRMTERRTIILGRTSLCMNSRNRRASPATSATVEQTQVRSLFPRSITSRSG